MKGINAKQTVFCLLLMAEIMAVILVIQHVILLIEIIRLILNQFDTIHFSMHCFNFMCGRKGVLVHSE